MNDFELKGKVTLFNVGSSFSYEAGINWKINYKLWFLQNVEGQHINVLDIFCGEAII